MEAGREAEAVMWSYADASGEQKGPIRDTILRRMVRRNLGLLTPDTLVWRPGLPSWTRLAETPELQELSACVFGQWHYAPTATGEGAAERQGPVAFPAVTKLLRDGALELQSLVWNPEVSPDWKAVAEIPTLLAVLEDLGDQAMPPGPKAASPAAQEGAGETKAEGGSDVQELLDLGGAAATSTGPAEGSGRGRKKNRKRVWARATSWIYVEGLPADVTVAELQEHFCKCGVIATDPQTGGPRIKIYRDPVSGEVKGDASVCFDSETSVPLAVQVFDGGPLRYGIPLKVSVATFQKKEGFTEDKKPRLTAAQLKVAKAAARQKLAWNEEDDSGLGTKALRIVVLGNLFDPADFQRSKTFGAHLERDVLEACSDHGPIDKVTIFSKHPQGVVIVKFATAFAAEECVKHRHGTFLRDRKVTCFYWDGVTDYTVVDEEEEAQRAAEFGQWLETQAKAEDDALPPELRLQVER